MTIRGLFAPGVTVFPIDRVDLGDGPSEPQILDQVQHVVVMCLGFDFVHHMLETAILADDEAGAQYAHALTAHELLQSPTTVLFGDLVVFV